MKREIVGLSEYCPCGKPAASEVFPHTLCWLRLSPARFKTEPPTCHGFRGPPEHIRLNSAKLERDMSNNGEWLGRKQKLNSHEKSEFSLAPFSKGAKLNFLLFRTTLLERASPGSPESCAKRIWRQRHRRAMELKLRHPAQQRSGPQGAHEPGGSQGAHRAPHISQFQQVLLG